MTLREAFNGIKFRKGTWRIWFDDEDDGDETEFYAESLDDLESLWNEFLLENNLRSDIVEQVFDIYDPYYGDWFDGTKADKEYVIDQIKFILKNKKLHELGEFEVLALRAAIEYINKANVKESFWVDGIENRLED